MPANLLPWIVVVLAMAASSTLQQVGAQQLPESCDSTIYCQGELLKTVQLASIFEDSKTFVDLKVRNSVKDTWADFNELMEKTGDQPSKEQIKEFVNNNFEEGDELVEWTPTDWQENPQILNKIIDPDFKQWAKGLNLRWRDLARQVNPNVTKNPELYSFIPVPNGFVIPGGRFREYYYWDSYWIVQGLLASGMYDTVKGILLNFMSIVQRIGHIPNGGRIYYLQRSQPPLLASMVEAYVEATKDTQFIIDNYDTLEKEMNFWFKNRTVKVYKDDKEYTLFYYFAPSNGPRPESYKEDYRLAQNYVDPTEMYTNLKSAAESGWDFSSKWFITKDGTNNGTLSDIATGEIVPVDLNGFIYRALNLLSNYAKIAQKHDGSNHKKSAESLKEAVEAVFWNQEEGIWFDWDLRNKKQRKYYYPTNFVPLWTGCYDESKTSEIAKSVVKYVKANKLETFPGGIPVSLERTGEQWDYPNAWPPLVGIVIEGIQNLKTEETEELALTLASAWLRSNYMGWNQFNESMFEKYDAETAGRRGSGGEYGVQEGFGWSNGLVMRLLELYGSIITNGD